MPSAHRKCGWPRPMGDPKHTGVSLMSVANGTSKFPPEFLAELRARTPLASLIGRTVKLSRAGKELKGRCPFHADKTPSLTVYPDHFHCYGCGKRGDVIEFVREIQHIDFQTAVVQLAA